jgi:MOSC domain-containing protein YiiM
VRKGPLTPVSRVDVSDDGLAGDHGRPGKRAVTLIQAEHLPVIATLCGVDSVAPAVLRRNLVISGINLRALREFGIAIGDIRLEITAPCAPCREWRRLWAPADTPLCGGTGDGVVGSSLVAFSGWAIQSIRIKNAPNQHLFARPGNKMGKLLPYRNH